MKTKLLMLALLTLGLMQQNHAQFIREYSKLPGQNVRFAAIIPVDETPTSNLYVAGNYGTYVFIGEFNQAGDPIWARKINVADTSITINQLIEDSNGHLVIVGASINGDFGKAFALKFNPFSKNLMWYQKSTVNSFFWDIAEMADGGDYVIGGQETGTGAGNQTDDITVIANRNTGTMTTISSLNKNINESVEALVYDENSASIYTTGRYELLSGASKFRICLSNLNTDGTVNFTRSYIESTATTGRYYSEDLMQDGDTLIIVGAGDDAGTNSIRYLWLIKTDMDGNAFLTNKYDITGVTNDGLFSAIKKHNDGYIVYGSLHNGSKFSDIFLFNLDQSGSIVWAKSYPFSTRTPTTGLYNSSSMAIVGEHIFQVGEKRQLDGTMKGVFMKTPVASGEVGECGTDIICTVTSLLDNYDAVQTLSQVSSAVTFTASAPTRSKHTFNSETTCAANGLGMESTNSDLLVEDNLDFKSELMEQVATVYPNPTTGLVLIKNPNDAGQLMKINLLDVSGALIQTYKSTEAQFVLNLQSFANGIYLVSIVDVESGAQDNVKVVKQ